ncbi:ATP-grasp domain-containing protein [Micromonospora sp. NPDC023956]|uniref:ATP-grasp domain-containing protein n=1 Tax=Micromonospora sp. NPDC023956 TaxID=3155722 RepID=UPI0033E70AFD
MLLLVPADPLRPHRPDQHFAPEATAAREAGVPVAVVDHDALARGDVKGALGRLPGRGEAVYRGWMLHAERYAAFAEALSAQGVTLRTRAEQYRRAHELPGWYPALTSVTPATTWTAGDGREAFELARVELGDGPAVLRDYCKSMKHHWDEAAFVPDLTDGEAAWAVARRFRELREDDFVGGFVLRRFERFTSAEVRTWWRDGRCVLVGPHPDTPDRPPVDDPDLTVVTPLVAALQLPFVTVDLALRDDGVWRVVELGDGQVSDRPTTVEPARLLTPALTPNLVDHGVVAPD